MNHSVTELAACSPAAVARPPGQPYPAMPTPTLTPREALEHLDARHDELIRKLDELNAQIEAALAEFSTRRETTEPQQELRKAA